MVRVALLAVVLVVGAPMLRSVVQACGDKFLMVGRGAKFQRAYASVHPGKVLIYARPTTDPKQRSVTPAAQGAAAGGHAVSVSKTGPAEQALKSVPGDVILVTRQAERRSPRVVLSDSSAAFKRLSGRPVEGAQPSLSQAGGTIA